MISLTTNYRNKYNMLKDRITNGIKFFRLFNDKSNSHLYQKSVLEFCNVVEEYVKGTEKYISDLENKNEPVTSTSEE